MCHFLLPNTLCSRHTYLSCGKFLIAEGWIEWEDKDDRSKREWTVFKKTVRMRQGRKMNINHKMEVDKNKYVLWATKELETIRKTNARKIQETVA